MCSGCIDVCHREKRVIIVQSKGEVVSEYVPTMVERRVQTELSQAETIPPAELTDGLRAQLAKRVGRKVFLF